MSKISEVQSYTNYTLSEQSDSSTIGRFSIANILDNLIAAISALFAGIFGVKSDESEKNVSEGVNPYNINLHGGNNTEKYVPSVEGGDRLPVVEEQDVRGFTPSAKKQDTGNGYKKTTDTDDLPNLAFVN